jgi:general secretion pathway protein J
MTPRAERRGTAGVTLVEVLVALVLFALIGIAGFSMLDQVLRTQRLTEGRLEDLAAMQRAMHLITLDFSQAREASLTEEPGADGPVVTLRRTAADVSPGQITLRYRLDRGVLRRDVSATAGLPPTTQALLGGVDAVAWEYHDRTEGWVTGWPIPGRQQGARDALPNPQAVAVTITRGDRQLRRVVLLPGAAY